MARRRWVRLDTNYDQQDWMEGLPERVRDLYPRLLCHVKAHGVRGSFDRQAPSNMARTLRCEAEDWSLLINAALASNYVTITDDGRYFISDWMETQEIDTERVRRWREKKDVAQ